MTATKHVKIEQGEWVVVCDGSKALFLENAGDSKFPNLKTREVLEQKVPPTINIACPTTGDNSFKQCGWTIPTGSTIGWLRRQPIGS